MADEFPEARWWHKADASQAEDSGRIVCDLCPRGCRLAPGGRGFCFVRQNVGGRMVSTTYGRSTGFCIDPIEKKPLNQFYPGSAVLSFGTAGCNMGCKFCQNWTSSKSREIDAYCEEAQPEAIAEAAHRLKCRSVAFTYNDPIVWAEYAIDTAKACRALDVKTVAVTSGYMTPQARSDFFQWIDAANVDLKGFSEDFYRTYCNAQLRPVVDSLRWLVRETDVWLELTTLLIPGCNDSPDELKRMCDWIAEELGTDIPIHFTAFHPDFQMLDTPPTPRQTLQMAHETAVKAGLHFVYTGNIHDPRNQSTYCPACGSMVIERDGYQLGRYELDGSRCRHCGEEVAGRFGQGKDDWQGGRLPVRIADYAKSQTSAQKSDNPGTKQAKAESRGKPVMIKRSEDVNDSGRIELDDSEKQAVLQAAAQRLTAAVLPQLPAPSEPLPAALAQRPMLGAFVTVKRKGRLRSCCGFIGQTAPLSTAIDHAATRTANDDPRFPPISPTELPYLDMEVWLLWGLEPVFARGDRRVDAIEIGRHGLQISRGQSRGLLLPGVAVENGFDAKTFLQHVCIKAGLPTDAWRDDDTILMTFEGLAIEGQLGDAIKLADEDLTPPGPSSEEVAALAAFARDNVVAQMQGAVPTCYMPGGYDGTVNGLHLTLNLGLDPDRPIAEEVSSLAIKPGMPLQSSLFNLTRAMATTLSRRGIQSVQAAQAKAGLSILWDAAMHGIVEGKNAKDIDLAGIDPRRRAVLALQQAGWTWAYDPQKNAEELVADALKNAHLSKNAAANVLSMAAASNEDRVSTGNIPEPDSPRPPAVAGQFYPGTPRQVSAAVDELIAEAGAHDRQPWAGAMVPHAGWVYSGKLAADVFSRVQLPENVIIFAPKHRPGGARWAVCPNSSWLLPGIRVEADPELARTLADAVDGFELDAAAHSQEHSVEVQLPLIARMSPQTKVTAVVMHGGDWTELEKAAQQLADVVRGLPNRPFLVISSDMNHYQNDEETCRLDRLALSAIEALDPKALLDTVVENRISMCGVTPAVLVMETLRRLGSLNQCELVGHYTSGEVSGDKSKVVGYAGMLFK